jgi:hypothetical protein
MIGGSSTANQSRKRVDRVLFPSRAYLMGSSPTLRDVASYRRMNGIETNTSSTNVGNLGHYIHPSDTELGDQIVHVPLRIADVRGRDYSSAPMRTVRRFDIFLSHSSKDKVKLSALQSSYGDGRRHERQHE